MKNIFARLFYRYTPLLLFALIYSTANYSQTISTIAGTGTAGYSGNGGAATAAKLQRPEDVFIDASNNVYIADGGNSCVRKINSSGIITTVAGTGSSGYSGDGGQATAATFRQITSVILDASGNIYIADMSNHRVRQVNTSGVVNTIAGNGSPGYSGDGGQATAAKLSNPLSMVLDASGNLYIADGGNNVIRKVNTSGIITTIAGGGGSLGDGGPATAAQFSWPRSLAMDASGNMFIADEYHHRIRIINTSGTINTIAGTGTPGFSGDGGPATAGKINYPTGVDIDASGNIYVADFYNHVVRKINTSGIISTVAGTGGSPGYSGDGGPATAAKLNDCAGVMVSSSGNIYAADFQNNAIREISVCTLPAAGTIAGLTTYCVGDTSTLTAAVSGGTWTVTNAHASISGGLVTAISAGTDTVKYTVSNSCGFAVDSVTITINPLPNASTITGTLTTMCVGASTTLTDTASGGRWSTVNSHATVTASGVVTGVSAGVDTILYSVTNSCATATAFYTITINPLPNAGTITGPASVCVGGSTTFTTTGSGGSWSISNASATVTSGGVVTGASAGIDTIYYTATNSCGTAVATKIVTISPLPNAGSISGSVTVLCAGATTTLTESVSGGTWSVSNTHATINTSGLVTAISAGTDTVKYSITNSCGTAIATYVISINPLPNAGTISGSATVCAGSNVIWTTTGSGGTWNASNGTASVSGGVVSGNTVGTDTISYTFTNSCGTDVATKPITVLPLPDAGTISGTGTTVCVAATLSLANTATGGTWSVTNTHASISGGLVTGVSAGTDTVLYTVTNSCGTAVSTYVITINLLPYAGTLSGPTNVCAASTITVSTTVGGGIWSSSTSNASVSGGVVTGVAPGTAIISYAVTNSCGTDHATLSISVNPVPVPITGTMAFCAGASVTLTDATTGGSWTSSNTTVATVDPSSGITTGISAGATTITYDRMGCLALASITVNPLPVAIITPLGDTTMCPGDFVVLSSSFGTGYSYQWYTGAGPISGETNDYYLATTAANYSVFITNTNGCQAYSSPMDVSINPATASLTAAGPTTICSGNSTALNANTGTGLSYQWMLAGAGITGATGSVYNAVTAGNYNVIVSNTAGCSATSTPVTINVLPAPSSTIVASGPLTFCSGGNVIITADTGAGYSYQWQVGGANIAGATSINYTANSTGNYQVVVTNSFPCSSTSTTATVTALALPDATISTSGSSTFCVGSSVLLNVPAISGNTYQWYLNGTSITGATNANYTTSTGGNFSTYITAASGCANATYPAFPVAELNIPVIIPMTQTTFCWGGSAVLGVSVSVSTGVSYQWLAGGSDIAGATNSIYNAYATGAYSCKVSLASGCAATSAATNVTQLPLPNPIITFDGIAMSTQGFYVSYQWFRDFNPITGIGNAIFPDVLGTYSVRVIDSNGCQSVSTGYIVTKIGSGRTLGLNTSNANDISIFPNPAQNTIYIHSPELVNSVVTAIDGRKLLETRNSQEIDIHSLANGTYLIMIYDGNGLLLKAEQIVKE